MIFVWLLCSLSVRIALAQARHSSHWMVTETGLIQPRDESPFLMTNPFDLLSFLNQETRWENILNLYSNLIRRQRNINKLWLKLEACTKFNKYIAENEDCVQVGAIDSTDWYTSFLVDGSYKGITEKEFAMQRSNYGDKDVPDCKKISSLTFSMFAFEHLDSMINRDKVNATPEFILPEQFLPIMTVDQFGHWISDALRKNSSSWLHYNLAALYWRVKGLMPKALECSRRAIHYAPRRYKDIPLLCMGTILHRSHRTEDALIVLGAALDHDPGFFMSHFSKGIALAAVGEYNNSLIHLTMSMKLDAQFDVAKRFRHGVLCHIHLVKKMQIARRSVKELSKVLREYTNLEKQWLKFLIAFLKTMKHEEEYDYSDFNAICAKMGEITGLKFKALKKDADRNSMVGAFIASPTYNEHWVKQKGPHALDTARALEKIITQLGEQTGLPTKKYLSPDESRNNTEILKEIGPMPNFPDLFPELKMFKPLLKANLRMEPRSTSVEKENIDTGILTPDTGELLYPKDFKVNRNRELFDTDPNWPSNEFCEENYPKVPKNAELIYPVFLPFSNKGIRLENLLTEKIGVPALVEHDLPWHPPVCPIDRDLPLYTQSKEIKIQMVPDSIGKGILRQHLLKYMSEGHFEIVNKMQDVEIGQRIQTAIKKKLAEKWMLYTIAALYWRVRGNIPSAVNCLLNAKRTADYRYRDVVLVSLASLFMEMGLLDSCSNHAEEAYSMSPYEPSTNFVLAQLSMIKKNHKAHIFHLKQAIRVDEHFMDGIVRTLLYEWSCVLKRIDKFEVSGDEEENEICAEVEPGVAMVCERDGTNCYVSNRDCPSTIQLEKSQIVRMLELKDDTIQGHPHVHEEISYSVFDKFAGGFPKARSDKGRHQKRYDELMKALNKVKEACKRDKACWKKEPGDFSVKEADCGYQQRQLDYWLYQVGFRQALTLIDAQHGAVMYKHDVVGARLSADIAATAPSKKSAPECKVPAGYANDFFLERIMKVDINGWELKPPLLDQFAEVYKSYDSSDMGAKLARYVEMNPQSWLGLIEAGWWCGANGRGQCAVRCLAAAHAQAPANQRALALRPLMAMLHVQSKHADALKIAYLSFYDAPRNEHDAFLVALMQTYRANYEFAAWMYRYAMSIDGDYVPAQASLHIVMCFMAYGDTFHKIQ